MLYSAARRGQCRTKFYKWTYHLCAMGVGTTSNLSRMAQHVISSEGWDDECEVHNAASVINMFQTRQSDLKKYEK